jgi:hypothetical protein
MNGINACSHTWIDPTAPPIARAPISPVIGDGRHEMHDGQTYVCSQCGHAIAIDVAAMRRAAVTP